MSGREITAFRKMARTGELKTPSIRPFWEGGDCPRILYAETSGFMRSVKELKSLATVSAARTNEIKSNG